MTRLRRKFGKKKQEEGVVAVGLLHSRCAVSPKASPHSGYSSEPSISIEEITKAIPRSGYSTAPACLNARSITKILSCPHTASSP
jgi:hypothetical protein